MSSPMIDVARAIRELSLEEKIKLLTGKDTWTTQPIERLNIPSITTSDGPHGVRGVSFFNGAPACLLPPATAMGATFDKDLMYIVGTLLGQEARERGISVLLGPTVCLQRSPLSGRSFEAFAEDPWLSGILASSYVNGIQDQGVGVSIKHFAAHDQSTLCIEDAIRASERTLRELHLLPFQLAVKNAQPWSFMTSYNKINGLHASENHWLLEEVLRREWGWDGLVMSDWFGTYSTSEAVNAGLDLEMPGPTRWRGELLLWEVVSRKVKPYVIDNRVRNLLNLINKVKPADDKALEWEASDTPQKREICRRTANSSIVVLKNDRGLLPLDPAAKGKTYGLIGPSVYNPSFNGGGSADLFPYYLNKPLDAISDVVGAENIQTSLGCHSHRFTPLLLENVTIPGTKKPGYALEWFRDYPGLDSTLTPLAFDTTQHAQIFFPDYIPDGVPPVYWFRARTTYTAPKTCTVQLGYCVSGKGRLFVDGKEVIDLVTSQPPKTTQTAIFNEATMEVIYELDVQQGQEYELTAFVINDNVSPSGAVLATAGLRIGCCEKIDAQKAIFEAVELATRVDIPIVIAGLNSDYETESSDRVSLDLPPGVDELIQRVVRENPNTIVVTQAGSPIAMPWVQDAYTLLHAWYGGQETGNAIADVLFGKVNPSGRLSMTFPRRAEDTPTFLSFGKVDREIYYGEGIFIGYRYYEKLRTHPYFFFGYGLSYTSFEYANFQAPTSLSLDGDSSIEVCVDVLNSGSRDGWEVVQVYIADKESSVLRPIKELKGFTKVWTKASETVTAKVSLDKYAFSFWDELMDKWVAEKGLYQIILATSADPKDEILRHDITLIEDFAWSGV